MAATQPRQQLLDYFRDRHTLLVLDNFEHLLDGAPLVTDILQASPHVNILATSREKLNLTGEIVYTLSGLHFPTWETPEDALAYDAVRLFMQSAQRVRPDFELHAEDLDYLARICRLTAGMPLGIVLAAGWVDVLTLAQIASEIQQGIDILETELRDVPERQRSVRSTFNYTWARLDDTERGVFVKLSVFRSGFTTEAAGAVAGANTRHLRKLVDKALVQTIAEGRYEVHELLRQYGEEHLIAAGESSMIYEAHARYYADFMQQRAPDVKGGRQLAGLNEIEADWNNVRAAWLWALDHQDWDAVGQMMEALHLFCDMRARYSEGDTLFQQALDVLAPQTGEEPNRLWGELLVRTAVVLTLPESSALLGRTNALLDLAEQQAGMGDDPFYLWARGKAVNARGRDERVLPLLEASLSGFRERDDHYYVAKVLRWMAFTSLQLGGQFAEQRERYNQQYVELTREIGDEMGMAHGLYYYGFPFWMAGQFDEAEPFLRQARDIWRQYGDWKSVGVITARLGQFAYERGEFEGARTLLSEAVQILSDVNFPTIKDLTLRILSEIACIEGDYVTGQQILADLVSDEYGLPPFGLLVAAVGQGNFQLARDHLRPWLHEYTSRPTQLYTVTLFPIIAILLVHEDRPEQAVELLALRDHVRPGATDRFSNWALLEQVRNDLESELGAEAYAAAWKRGANLDLQTVAEALLVEFAANKDE